MREGGKEEKKTKPKHNNRKTKTTQPNPNYSQVRIGTSPDNSKEVRQKARER